jgi:thiol-disulfide isomerase/thioredoxin
MALTNKFIVLMALFIGFFVTGCDTNTFGGTNTSVAIEGADGVVSTEQGVLDKKIAVGHVVPDFELADFNTGKPVNIADFRGKVVYMDFWASWCKPCVQSFPALKQIHHKYQSQGFEIVAINVDFKKDKALAFLRENPISYTSLNDKDMAISKMFNVNVMPTGYFIDRKGMIRYVHKGFVPGDEKSIDQAVHMLLSEK